MEYKLGARGLRSLCEAVLTDAMFELPGSGEKEFRVLKPSSQQAQQVKAASTEGGFLTIHIK